MLESIKHINNDIRIISISISISKSKSKKIKE